MFSSVRPSYFFQDRFFLFSLLSVLFLNFVTVTLTWLVVFKWNVGFEYNPNSLWQLSTYGPVATLIVTQLTLAGVFFLVKSGLSHISKIKQRQIIQSKKSLNGKEIEKFQKVGLRYRQITRIVLSAILLIILIDAVNDVSNVLVLFHVF